MTLNLNKDLIYFDIEATGLHVIRDRIMQLAMIKYFADGTPPAEKDYLINPGIPISEEAFAIHGISVDDVRHKPGFQQLAEEVYTFIGDADLAGYGPNRMDLPMLMEELARAGFELSLDQRRVIDVQRIFYKMEPRTLAAAHRFYCKKGAGNAHDAMADVRATISVLDGQLAMYENTDLIQEDGIVVEKPIQNDIQKLYDFTNDLRMVEPTQKLKYDYNGNVVINFGKYAGQPAGKTLYENQNYYNWILNKEFSFQVKQIVRELRKKYKEELGQGEENIGEAG